MDGNSIQVVMKLKWSLQEAITVYNSMLIKLRENAWDQFDPDQSYLRSSCHCWQQLPEERSILKLTIQAVKTGEMSVERAEKILGETIGELETAHRLIGISM